MVRVPEGSVPSLTKNQQVVDYLLTLLDQQGRSFGSADRAGRAVRLSFVYAHCTDTCPLPTAIMSQVQDRLRAEGLLGTRVQLASVTVDPRRDTPPVLAEYAGRFKADPDAWRFLSGEPDAIYAVLAGFKLNTVEVARASEGADVIPHSDRIVAPRLSIRGAQDRCSPRTTFLFELPVVFTYAVEHPELQCLVTWARLERRVGPTAHAHRIQLHVHHWPRSKLWRGTDSYRPTSRRNRSSRSSRASWSSIGVKQLPRTSSVGSRIHLTAPSDKPRTS